MIMLSPLLGVAQNLTETTPLIISKSWSQEPNGYTYPMSIHVPAGAVPQDGFPVCILLHGNGGNGFAMRGQFEGILQCHVLVAPTGYENSWNICAEDSDAPDVEMLDDLISMLQGYDNINPNKIRVLGSSNGGGLVNRIYIENRSPNLDILTAIVTQLNDPQYHSGGFYQPTNSTSSSAAFCGYDSLVTPIATRKYLSICNTNDPIIPYLGGTSVVGVDFLSAEEAVFTLAQHQGFTGSQLTGGTTMGNPAVTEFSYLSGEVVLIAGDAAHGTNATQRDYLRNFLGDCGLSTDREQREETTWKLYPNPVASTLSVERNTAVSEVYSILNPMGELVEQGRLFSLITQMDLSSLAPGVYFFKAGKQVAKIIKSE